MKAEGYTLIDLGGLDVRNIMYTPYRGYDFASARRSKKEKKKVRRQDNPFKPAPPEGLTLECVYYDDNF